MLHHTVWAELFLNGIWLGLGISGILGGLAVEIDHKFEKNLITGTISLTLLHIIARSGEALYGYQIARAMESLDDQEIGLKQGTIYPVLRNMEKAGYLVSHILPSGSGPPRKYYAITPAGIQRLEIWKRSWYRMRDFVTNILGDSQ